MALFRGAFPSPPHRIDGANKYIPKEAAPFSFLRIPQLDMWGNQIFGDCVSAEEAFAKSYGGVFIPQAKVVKWAKNHWVLNGAGIWDVLNMMQKDGFWHGTEQYNDGPFHYVNYTSMAVLRSAIVQGPIKLGVQADELINVPNIGVVNGWLAQNFKGGNPLDHCVSLCGYGPFSWLAGQLGSELPSNVNGDTPGFAMFTWSTIGIIDMPSLQAICGEAWLRQPTTESIERLKKGMDAPAKPTLH